MANSNENTQNPKENQEKMADKGIQDHSEHTAENKQPETFAKKSFPPTAET